LALYRVAFREILIGANDQSLCQGKVDVWMSIFQGAFKEIWLTVEGEMVGFLSFWVVRNDPKGWLWGKLGRY
jgi:hypothetical protein